jgi:hypothetical protein
VNFSYGKENKCLRLILKRFHVMDCKPMTTPMMSNLMLRADFNSDLIDPSVYVQ